MGNYTVQEETNQEEAIKLFPFFLRQLEPLLQELLEKLTWLCLEINRRGPILEEHLMRLEDTMATLDDIQRLEAQIKDLRRLIENTDKPPPGPGPEAKPTIPKPEGYL